MSVMLTMLTVTWHPANAAYDAHAAYAIFVPPHAISTPLLPVTSVGPIQPIDLGWRTNF